MRPISHKRISKEIEKHMRFFNRKSPEKFQIMNVEWVVEVVKFGLRVAGLAKKSFKNALDLSVVEKTIFLENLPQEFDSYKILFMTDFHIDSIDGFADNVLDVVGDLDYDLCLLGGDYRYRTYGSCFKASTEMVRVVKVLKEKSRVVGVLGNHDQYHIGAALEVAGVDMLLNENLLLERNGESICLAGVDDCHYYVAHDLKKSLEGIPEDCFTILLSHSPELYKEAVVEEIDLYLAGHTHGGQLCLPGRFALISEARVPRRMIYGEWCYKQMRGYTTSGIGTSGTVARLNCPPEAALLTLKRPDAL